MRNGDVYIKGIGNYDGTNPSSATSTQAMVAEIEASIAAKESTDNKVTAIDDESTDEQYPSAKAVFNSVKELSEEVFNAMAFKADGEEVEAIEDKIPAQASSTNQLADKDFVNSSINALAAFYITSNAAGDAFATKAGLLAGPYYNGGVVRVPTKNDYAIVLADESKANATTRYSFDGSVWAYQYKVNDTPLTAAQLAALNSGITAAGVALIPTQSEQDGWDAKYDKPSAGIPKPTLRVRCRPRWGRRTQLYNLPLWTQRPTRWRRYPSRTQPHHRNLHRTPCISSQRGQMTLLFPSGRR